LKAAAIREVNAVMAGCKVKQRPAKTHIGRVCNGFDFLGYAFSPEGLGVRPQEHRALGGARNPAL
jgi:hypothetical protein